MRATVVTRKERQVQEYIDYALIHDPRPEMFEAYKRLEAAGLKMEQGGNYLKEVRPGVTVLHYDYLADKQAEEEYGRELLKFYDMMDMTLAVIHCHLER